MTPPISMAPRILLPGEVERSGRALLAEASIAHAKVVQLGIYLEQTMTDLLDAEGTYTEGRLPAGRKAGDYTQQIRAYVVELVDLVEWVDDGFAIHGMLRAVGHYANYLDNLAAQHGRGEA